MVKTGEGFCRVSCVVNVSGVRFHVTIHLVHTQLDLLASHVNKSRVLNKYMPVFCGFFQPAAVNMFIFISLYVSVSRSYLRNKTYKQTSFDINCATMRVSRVHHKIYDVQIHTRTLYHKKTFLYEMLM